MSFEIKVGKVNRLENPQRYEQYSEAVEKIIEKIEQIKQKYGAQNSEMSSFNPNLLPENHRPMMLSENVYADYQKVLQLTNENNIEYNFLWLGNKKELNGQEYYSIENVVTLPRPSTSEQSSVNPLEKLKIYDSQLHDGYDVIIDGHSHPAQDPTYKGFDQLPRPLLDELSLKKPGENFSISDLFHYQSLLNGSSKVKDKIIIGSVITYTGELLTIVSDPSDNTAMPTTIKQTGADIPSGVLTLKSHSHTGKPSSGNGSSVNPSPSTSFLNP